MAKNIKLQNIKDFRGGINLRGDGFELAPDESPDLMNVDIDPRGGLQSRAGIHVQTVTWGNANVLNPNEATAKDAIDNSRVGRSNNTGVRVTGAGPAALNGRAAIGTWDRVTIPAASGSYKSVGFAVVGLERWSIGAYMKSSSGSLHQVAVKLDWYTSAGGTYISQTTSATPNLTTNWQFVSLVGIAAPSNATYCIASVWPAQTTPTANSVVDVAGWHIAKGYNATYFDQTILDLPGEITSFGRYVTNTAVQVYDQLHVIAGGVWVYANTATPTTWFVMMNWSSDGYFVQFRDNFWVGEQNMFTRGWDGYTLTQVSELYNDNLAAPTNDRFPIMGRSNPAVFQGVVFCAVGQDPVTTVQRNRLRWSHPNSGGDWRSFDYIDIDIGVDGDYITALVPFGDRLLIFKRHSVYALSGTSPDTFQVYPISRRVGAVDSRAVALTEAGVYFYDEREGVFFFDGKGLRWQFQRIYPLITHGHIAPTEVHRVRLGWSGRRLWVAVPWRADRLAAAPVNNTRVFVLDPTLSKEGSWTQYDCVIGAMHEFTRTGQSVRLLGARPYFGRVYVLEDAASAPLAYDTLIVSNAQTTVHIASHYVTPWYDTGQPAIEKRWRKPEFVVRSVNADSLLEVEVRRDFDSRITRRRFNLVTEPDEAEMLWGDNWGEIWAGSNTASPASVILSGPTLGKAKAIQLKVNGPPTNNHWGLNAITLKYTPLPPRS